jgi:hypothetical protein
MICTRRARMSAVLAAVMVVAVVGVLAAVVVTGAGVVVVVAVAHDGRLLSRSLRTITGGSVITGVSRRQ